MYKSKPDTELSKGRGARSCDTVPLGDSRNKEKAPRWDKELILTVTWTCSSTDTAAQSSPTGRKRRTS